MDREPVCRCRHGGRCRHGERHLRRLSRRSGACPGGGRSAACRHKASRRQSSGGRSRRQGCGAGSRRSGRTAARRFRRPRPKSSRPCRTRIWSRRSRSAPSTRSSCPATIRPIARSSSLDGMAPAEDAFFVDVTVPNEEPIAADAEDDGSADETQTAAIAPDAAESDEHADHRSRSARRPRSAKPSSRADRSPRFPASTSAGLPATHLPQTTIPAARSAR